MRRGLAVTAALFVCLAGANLALADGDPASDVLPVQDVFAGYPPPPSAKSLAASVAKVFASGHRIKVAVILNRMYLGSIPSLFGKPAAYAHFLGEELTFVYRGPLLIVMPSGFGIWDANHSTATEAAVLSKLKVEGSSLRALVAAATSAVDALAAEKVLTSPDTVPPTVYPQPSTAHPGQSASLTYNVVEDSERSSEIVSVRSGSRVFATLRSPMQAATYSAPHSVEWQVPAGVPRKGLEFCVVATDPSGNTSTRPACSTVKVG